MKHQDLIHGANKPVDEVLTVSGITALDEVFGDGLESSEGR